MAVLDPTKSGKVKTGTLQSIVFDFMRNERSNFWFEAQHTPVTAAEALTALKTA